MLCYFYSVFSDDVILFSVCGCYQFPRCAPGGASAHAPTPFLFLFSVFQRCGLRAVILLGFAPLSRSTVLHLVLPIHKIRYRLVKTLHRLYLHIFVAEIFVQLFR